MAIADPVRIRVLIVDDSIVARTVFQRMLNATRDIAVCGVALGAAAALALLADLTVDVILLDIAMPGMDGLTALPAILAAGGGAHVVIVSSTADEGAVTSMRALALGASDTVLKPTAGDLGIGFADRLADCLRRLGRTARPQIKANGVVPITGGATPVLHRDPVGCVAIGASTGGMVALTALFEALDARCTAPILVTQHLPAEFMPYFADQLSEVGGRRAMLAVAGQAVLPGQLLVATGTDHLSLMRDGDTVRVRQDRQPAASGCMPSVDPMLAAVADVFGSSGVGVILSGMGRDGAAGAARLAAAGGEILVQDVQSATVWGMPGAVARAGLADAVLPPAAIGRRIVVRSIAAANASARDVQGVAAWK